MDANDETNITELELLPDGRIFVFGASVEVLEILNLIQNESDSTLKDRLISRMASDDTQHDSREGN